MSEDFTNTLRFTNEGGTNRLILNGEDIASKVDVEGFSITLDRRTLKPLLTVRYCLDEIEVDVQEAAVEAKA